MISVGASFGCLHIGDLAADIFSGVSSRVFTEVFTEVSTAVSTEVFAQKPQMHVCLCRGLAGFQFVQQLLHKLPWRHNLVVPDKLPGPEIRRWYAANSIEQIERELANRDASTEADNK